MWGEPKPKEKDTGVFCWGNPCAEKWGKQTTMIRHHCDREAVNCWYCPECWTTHPCGMGLHSPDCAITRGAT